MDVTNHATAIAGGLARAGIEAPVSLVTALALYVATLAKWNRTINLTAFDLDQSTDEAIDRLVVEPLQALPLVQDAGSLIDVGSGSGSPAIPIALAKPGLRLKMIESKTRKAAFLRAVARELGRPNWRVETARAEAVRMTELADVVTLRAVRPDPALQDTIARLVKPEGRVFWFCGPDAARLERMLWQDEIPLVTGGSIGVYSRR